MNTVLMPNPPGEDTRPTPKKKRVVFDFDAQRCGCWRSSLFVAFPLPPKSRELVKEHRMISVCAVCGKYMGLKQCVEKVDGWLTHGQCPACTARIMEAFYKSQEVLGGVI